MHSFGYGSDGRYPAASLIGVGGTLYGTTSGGGSNNCGYFSDYFPCGTVFSITPSGSEKVLHIFERPDGISPVASLIEVNGTLYGTTENGGTGHKCLGRCGTVFSITPSGTEKVLHSFGKGTDGAYPFASLIDVKGKLYGTTEGGGAYDYYGTVFSITPSGKEKVVHSFSYGIDGSFPTTSVIDVNGTLYGTTLGPRAYDGGTVFSITPSGREKILHNFGDGSDGANPNARLVDVGGTLYGTTSGGGALGFGTVFSITPSGAEKVLHSFSGSDGKSPNAGLIYVKGMLYGTTGSGGAN